MKEKLGIPYMGSKRKLSSDILHLITQRHPDVTDFYDLFGGGGSISFTALRDYRFNVHYNELNSHIYHLVNYLKENKELDKKFYEWVSCKEFFNQINRLDADWYSGFVMSCWSFGNNQKCYLYGADIEDSKRLAHEFIVNGCLESMQKLDLNIPELLNIKDLHKRRVLFCNHIKTIKNRFDIQNLEIIIQLERIQNLQNLQNLQTSNLSYENVVITGDNPVIYCDIPYKETASYQKKIKLKNINNYDEIETRIVTNIRYNSKGEPYEFTRRYPVKGQASKEVFNHDDFYNWFANSPYPAYLSEYNAPFERVEMLSHRSTLSGSSNKKKVVESIFWNGKGCVNNYKLF